MKEFAIYQDDKGNWVVTSDKIPGFEARGETPMEAINKMKQAFKIYYPCGECRDK
jgi:predicted RNase H-like HicB family nuclease